jgi:2'-5' RNA ligase
MLEPPHRLARLDLRSSALSTFRLPSLWTAPKSIVATAKQERTVSSIERAIVVPVPIAEPITARLRDERMRALRVPAHVTLLFPFVETERVDDAMVNELRDFFARVRRFPFQLATVDVFEGSGHAGSSVIWLRPVPQEPFIELTNALSERYDIAPYGGAFAAVQPHLTVTHVPDGSSREHVYGRLAPHLPLACRADEATLLEEGHTAWRTVARFPFASGPQGLGEEST